jgi:hypothetical protein
MRCLGANISGLECMGNIVLILLMFQMLNHEVLLFFFLFLLLKSLIWLLWQKISFITTPFMVAVSRRCIYLSLEATFLDCMAVLPIE